MRFSTPPVVGPPSLVRSPGRLDAPATRTSRDVRVDLPGADAGRAADGYVDFVHAAPTPFSRMEHWARDLNPWVLDAVLGSVFTVVGIVTVFGDDVHGKYRKGGALGVALSLLCTLPFFVRRRFPASHVFVVSTGLVLLSTLEFHSNFQSQIIIISAYTVGAHSAGLDRLLGFLSIMVGVTTVAVVGIPDATTGNIAAAGATYAAAFFLGIAMRNRRLYMEQLEERTALLERERDEEAKRAVADERLRIAQELHDVVAHSMGVIAVQAAVGSHVIEQDPVEAKRSLDAIAATSRSSLTEIRRLLGVLRSDGEGGYEPAPALTDLDALFADVDAAGLPVTVRVDGERTELPPGVDLTAYRIVQEALTNVLKHAGPAHATVTIGYEPGALRLEITDDGRGVNGRGPGTGHGLLGMRERVAVYGGSLDVGPLTGGGFRVRAHLPYGEPA
jgi:signal transduction histidine kinase